jgi:hypothetical protein
MADSSVVAHVDEDGNTFYEDPATGATAWSAQELTPAAAEEWAVEQAPAEDDSGGAHEQWEVHASAEGHAYYYNPVSGKTRWELPYGASVAEGDDAVLHQAAAAAAAAAGGDADAEAVAAATAAAAVRDWGEPEHPVLTLAVATVPRQTSISWDGGTEHHHHAADAAAAAAGAGPPDVKRPTTPAGAPPPRKHSAAAKSRWALVRRASERFELGERVGSPGRQIIRRGSEGVPGGAGGAGGAGGSHNGSGAKGGGLLAIATAVQQQEALNRQHPASPTHSAVGGTPPVSPGRPSMVLGGGGGVGADSSSSADYGAAAMRAAAARVAQLEGDLGTLKTRFVANLKTLAAQQQKAAEEARAHAACREEAARQLAEAEEARAAATAARAAAEEAEGARAVAAAAAAAAAVAAEQARLQVLELDELARSLQAQLDDALGESSAMGEELAALRAEGGGGYGADGATARLRQQLAEAREENRTIRELAKKAADTNTSLISMIAAPPPRGERPAAGRERRDSTSFMLQDAAETAAAEARAMAPSPQGGAGVGGAAAARGAEAEGLAGPKARAAALRAAAAAKLEAAAYAEEAARLESEAAVLEQKDAGGTSSHARTVSSGRVPRKRSSFKTVSPGGGHGSAELGSISESSER